MSHFAFPVTFQGVRTREPRAAYLKRPPRTRRAVPIGQPENQGGRGQCLNANDSSIGVSGMAQSSRYRRATIIPQTVTTRTETARRSGTRRARGFGGRGAPIRGGCGCAALRLNSVRSPHEDSYLHEGRAVKK